MAVRKIIFFSHPPPPHPPNRFPHFLQRCTILVNIQTLHVWRAKMFVIGCHGRSLPGARGAKPPYWFYQGLVGGLNGLSPHAWKRFNICKASVRKIWLLHKCKNSRRGWIFFILLHRFLTTAQYFLTTAQNLCSSQKLICAATAQICDYYTYFFNQILLYLLFTNNTQHSLMRTYFLAAFKCRAEY